MSSPLGVRGYGADRRRPKRIAFRVITTTVLAAGLVAGAAAQTVNNVRAGLESNSNTATITYDLHSTLPEEFHVKVFYSVDDGVTFVPAPQVLSGDVGPHVLPGVDKSFQWENFATDMSQFEGQHAIFRVVAGPGEDTYVIQFEEAMTTASESQGFAELAITSSEPFYGTVRYTVSALTNVAMGPVANPDIGQISGEVAMTGRSAVITIPLVDDFHIESPKALTLDLAYDESLGYTPGVQFRTMLVLYDDDGYWNGMLRGFRAADGELPFRMAMARKDGQLSATLVSRIDSADGSTAFPVGDWPVTATWDGTVFTADCDNISVPPSTLFADAGQMKRRLSLRADINATGTLVQMDKVVMGYSTDAVTAEGDASYLNATSEGGFLMIKEVVPFTPPEPEIMPLPSALSAPSGGKLPTDAVLEIKEAHQ